MKKLEFAIDHTITDEQRSKIILFLSKNADKRVSATFEAIDGAMWHQHKYYRGVLLPSIIDSWGDRSAHSYLKKRFLLKDIYSLEDIPTKHKRNVMIFVDNEGAPIAYIPSTGSLTQDEFRAYILNCEDFLYIDVMGCIEPEFNNDIKRMREDAGL